MSTRAKRQHSQKVLDWIEARKRFHLSHAEVQMARELGMNPKKLGKLDSHNQEPWKAPLPEFIEHLYLKRFGKERPEVVVAIEKRARLAEAKKAARKELRRRARRDSFRRSGLSEYQYYEFQAVDRPLTAKEMAELRSFSTRARITPTTFVNDYSWGSFNGDEDAWMETYFDAFLYLASWGTRVLKLALPNHLLDATSARGYCAGERCRCVTAAER